ncbi:MAG: CvpA family protein [Flavobacteriales bacterium]
MDFNHWDIILFIPLAWAAWKGFRKGLIIELASIAALIAGVYIAANFSEFVEGRLKLWFELEGSWTGYLAFILTFAAVVFGVYALAKVVEKAVNLVALKLANKLAGSFFGLTKMVLIISIILNLISWMDQLVPVMQKSDPENSLLFEPILNAGPAVLPVLTQSDWMGKAEEIMQPLFSEEQE